MTNNSLEIRVITERLGELERQNQRFKRGCIAMLALLSVVILVGQMPSSPRIVEAQKFVLKDAAGNVRGWMGVVGKGSEITLGNVNAQPMMELMVSGDASDLHFFGSRGSGMTLGVNSGDPSISMLDADQNGEAGMGLTKDGPKLVLQDGKGFSTIAGATQLDSAPHGRARKTSAASIVLLGKDKNVIWQTP